MSREYCDGGKFECSDAAGLLGGYSVMSAGSVVSKRT
jgi:hypothetical protein